MGDHMSDIEQPNEGENDASGAESVPRRRWLPWTIVGGVAAVAVAAAFVLVPGLTRPDRPAPQPDDSTTPTATPTATPTCTVTPLDTATFDPYALTLPTDGAFTTVPVTEVTGDYVSAIEVDDRRIAVTTSTYGNTGAELLVVELSTGGVMWRMPLGNSGVVSTPALTGVPDVIITATPTEGYLSNVLTAYDVATGAITTSAEVPGDWVGAIPSDAGVAGPERVVPEDPDALFVSNGDSAMRLDAATLAVEWTLTGADYGVGQFEGGVPFSLVGDVFFVGGIAFDATAGTQLGWETEWHPITAAGHALVTPIVYDSLDPYTLAGLDLRMGEECWSMDVVSVAAQGRDLWVVTTDEVLRRIDPATGETIDTVATVGYVQVEVHGEYLLTTPREWNPDGRESMTVRSSDGTWERDSTDDGGPAMESGGQLLTTTSATVDTSGELTAHKGDGSTAWSLVTWDAVSDARVQTVSDILLRTTPIETGMLRIELLR